MIPSTAGENQQPNSLQCHVIEATEHPIRPEMIDRDALYVLRKLHQAGYAGYLVGGGVRDLYLGKTPKDFDISTNARPGQLRKLFPRSNTIGRRFRLVQIFFKGGKAIEVSTLRSLSEHDLDGPESVLAPNNTFGTLSEDARRRDLTINSLFYEIQNNTIIDYVDGSKDLDNSIIRIVGIPERRIGRDPVRILRAIRHCSRNNFTIEEQSWKAIEANSHKLSLCPPSRLRDEFLKDLYSEAAAPWFTLAYKSGVFKTLFPIYARSIEESSETSLSLYQELQQIFTTIDRINGLSVSNGIHRQPDYFLIALFLTPWIESKFKLYSQFNKGAALFQISKKIRAEIDKTIGTELNLRRSMRQEIVTLTINLSQLLHNRQSNGWPKWLQKKSYFKKCLRFYYFYQETQNNTTVTLDMISSETQAPPPTNQNRSQQTDGPAPKYRPAFSPNAKGGVFGFKR